MGNGQQDETKLPLTGRRIVIDQRPLPRPAGARELDILENQKLHKAYKIDYTRRKLPTAPEASNPQADVSQ